MNIGHRNGGRWLALLAGLPLLGLPLRAAEPPEPAADEPPAAADPQAPESAQASPPPAAETPAPPRAAGPANEEKISVDNNLSFPVDI